MGTLNISQGDFSVDCWSCGKKSCWVLLPCSFEGDQVAIAEKQWSIAENWMDFLLKFAKHDQIQGLIGAPGLSHTFQKKKPSSVIVAAYERDVFFEWNCEFIIIYI